MAITIKEIAELAGVSRGTVDRVIHGRYGVDPAVVSRVEAILKQLNYTPNTVAKALKKAQKHIKIGIIVPNSRNPFFLDILKGFNEAGKVYESYGVRMILSELDQTRAKDQLVCIDRMLHEGVDGLIIAAIDDEAIVQKVNTIAHRVPTITYNTDLTNSRRICFVGQDHVASGSVAADLMGKSLHREGKVAVLISQWDMLAHAQRAKGFRSTLGRNHEQFELLETLETYESDELAFRVVSELIAQTEDLVGIYVAGGGQAGAGRALEKSGKADRIVMICCDLTPDVVELVKLGIVDYTIGQEPFVQGYMPVKIMYEYIVMNIRPKWEQLFTHIDIRVRENISLKGFEVFTGQHSINPYDTVDL